jgi:uncharacterized membrane protein
MLPLIMTSLESVTELGGGKSHWVAKGISGTKVKWDAETFQDKPNELIAWRSVEPADVPNAGSVRFQAGPDGRGTSLQVTLNYNPPAGKLGVGIAHLFGFDPAQLIKEDLRRFKQMLESGEVATIEGQTSGREAEAATGPENPSATDEKVATMGHPETESEATSSKKKAKPAGSGK